MGKAEELLAAQGGAIKLSTAHRPAPLAMPTGGASVPLTPARPEGVIRSKSTFEIPLSKIRRDPDQPREEFDGDALERLADSIRKKGLLQPISVRKLDAEEFMIVAGERRWRAAELAGLRSITCVVYEREIPPGELLALQCMENLLRENLTKTEQARAYRALLAANNWTQEQLAEELNVSQATISQALTVLTLPADVQAHVDNKRLASTVAAEIASKIEDPEDQRKAAAAIVEGDLPRGEARDVINQAAAGSRKAKPAKGGKGRGASKAKPKPVTIRTFKNDQGIRITAERARGIDPNALALALEDAAAKVRAEIAAEQGGESEAA